MTVGLASAHGIVVYGGAELEFLHEKFGPATGTNSYFSGYVKAEVRGFYGGLWGQLANDDLLDEVNL